MGPPLSQILKAQARKSTVSRMAGGSSLQATEGVGASASAPKTSKKQKAVREPTSKSTPKRIRKISSEPPTQMPMPQVQLGLGETPNSLAAPVPTQLPKRVRKKVLVPPKQLELSITISVGNSDIPLSYLQKMEEFLDTECISGLCSIERGGALQRLHLQMVCRIMAPSAAVVSKRIKTHLGWDKAATAPVGHHILSRTLRNTGLHTFIGMLGYCIKDKGEDHFDCVYRNVTPQQMDEGIEEYVKHGTPFAKNRVILTHKNLMERAATFCRYKLKKQLGTTIAGVLLAMLQSGQYIPSASWVLPARQGGMEYTRASALWKCMMQPATITMDDVTQIFFEHTNPGSQLADLGRQRLAVTLNDAREGAPCDYVVPDIVVGDAKRQPDDVIVVNDSQNVAIPDLVIGNAERQPNDIIVVSDSQDVAVLSSTLADTTSHSLVHRTEAMFIPIVYGDRDNFNSFCI